MSKIRQALFVALIAVIAVVGVVVGMTDLVNTLNADEAQAGEPATEPTEAPAPAVPTEAEPRYATVLMCGDLERYDLHPEHRDLTGEAVRLLQDLEDSLGAGSDGLLWSQRVEQQCPEYLPLYEELTA